jgi:hypothetical protein
VVTGFDLKSNAISRAGSNPAVDEFFFFSRAAGGDNRGGQGDEKKVRGKGGNKKQNEDRGRRCPPNLFLPWYRRADKTTVLVLKKCAHGRKKRNTKSESSSLVVAESVHLLPFLRFAFLWS